MKKKIAYTLLALLSVLMVAACSSEPSNNKAQEPAIDYNKDNIVIGKWETTLHGQSADATVLLELSSDQTGKLYEICDGFILAISGTWSATSATKGSVTFSLEGLGLQNYSTVVSFEIVSGFLSLKSSVLSMLLSTFDLDENDPISIIPNTNTDTLTLQPTLEFNYYIPESEEIVLPTITFPETKEDVYEMYPRTITYVYEGHNVYEEPYAYEEIYGFVFDDSDKLVEIDFFRFSGDNLITEATQINIMTWDGDSLSQIELFIFDEYGSCHRYIEGYDRTSFSGEVNSYFEDCLGSSTGVKYYYDNGKGEWVKNPIIDTIVWEYDEKYSDAEHHEVTIKNGNISSEYITNSETGEVVEEWQYNYSDSVQNPYWKDPYWNSSSSLHNVRRENWRYKTSLGGSYESEALDQMVSTTLRDMEGFKSMKYYPLYTRTYDENQVIREETIYNSSSTITIKTYDGNHVLTDTDYESWAGPQKSDQYFIRGFKVSDLPWEVRYASFVLVDNLSFSLREFNAFF